MRAALRHLHSPDVYDLRAYIPDDPAHFYILVQAMIGPEDEEGEESFAFVVCSPKALLDVLNETGLVWGRHHIFMSTYDYELLEEAIKEVCESVQGDNWDTVAAQVARYGSWEFEDYRD